MKKTIAVFFGGQSPEHDISIVTALSAVVRPLELSGRYTVVPIYIAKNGAWYSDDSLKDIATYRSGTIDEAIAKFKPVSAVFDGGFAIEKAGFKKSRIAIDLAFPAMHGGHGEDGSLMGLLRLANIPFVGCDIEASVVAMDKVLAKQVAEANSIPVAKYEYVVGKKCSEDPEELIKKIEVSLHYPLFVKPAHLGSSIGITRATTTDELRNALEVAAYYDDKIIIEEAVQNLIEVTVPIIGNDILQVALVEKPLSHDEAFFDFNTKYMNGGKKGGGKKAGAQGYSELPAELPKELYDTCVETAKSVYSATGCEGTARIDLLIDSKANTVYFNEINPLPGSLYAHNWHKAGVSGVELVERLVSLAEERFETQQKLQKTFSTSFLKQF